MTDQLPFIPSQLDNYSDAIWAEGFFSKEEVDEILRVFEKSDKNEASLSDTGDVVSDLRKSTVAFLPPADVEYKHIIEKLGGLAIHVNAQHYRFDLMGFFEPIQIAEYGVEDFFDWHTDFGTGQASTRKLSLSVQLSEPDTYEGGDLQFRINQDEEVAPRTLGTVIIFPSFVQHRVTPITKGTRRSMVGWVTGVPYR